MRSRTPSPRPGHGDHHRRATPGRVLAAAAGYSLVIVDKVPSGAHGRGRHRRALRAEPAAATIPVLAVAQSARPRGADRAAGGGRGRRHHQALRRGWSSTAASRPLALHFQRPSRPARSTWRRPSAGPDGAADRVRVQPQGRRRHDDHRHEPRPDRRRAPSQARRCSSTSTSPSGRSPRTSTCSRSSRSWSSSATTAPCASPELFRTYPVQHASGRPRPRGAAVARASRTLVTAEHVELDPRAGAGGVRRGGRGRRRIARRPDAGDLQPLRHRHRARAARDPRAQRRPPAAGPADRDGRRRRDRRCSCSTTRSRASCSGAPTSRPRWARRSQADLPYDPIVYLKAVNEGVPVVRGAPKSSRRTGCARSRPSCSGRIRRPSPRRRREGEARPVRPSPLTVPVGRAVRAGRVYCRCCSKRKRGPGHPDGPVRPREPMRH